jgi:hypothetical protein
MIFENNKPIVNQKSCPRCHSSHLVIALFDGYEQCVFCTSGLDRTRNIHVSYLYLEVMTTMAVTETYFGDTADTLESYSGAII